MPAGGRAGSRSTICWARPYASTQAPHPYLSTLGGPSQSHYNSTLFLKCLLSTITLNPQQTPKRRDRTFCTITPSSSISFSASFDNLHNAGFRYQERRPGHGQVSKNSMQSTSPATRTRPRSCHNLRSNLYSKYGVASFYAVMRPALSSFIELRLRLRSPAAGVALRGAETNRSAATLS